MKRYYLGILFGMVAAPAFLYATALWLPTRTVAAAQWVSACLEAKADMARKTNEPQILLLSGSNSLLGFSSDYIRSHYGIASTNLGVHAGLGRKYILYYGLQLAKKGDLVVMPLEYSLYGPEHYDNALTLQVLVADVDYFRQLTLPEQMKLIANVTLSEWIAFAKNRLSPDGKQQSGCQVETLDRYGDETVNKTTNVDARILARLSRMQPMQYEFDENAVADFVRFKNDLSARGVSVVLTYPNILENAFDQKRNNAFFESLAYLSDISGITYAGMPHDRVFPLEDAFDTEYHQNDIGVLKSTDILMRQLNNAKIALPVPAESKR